MLAVRYPYFFEEAHRELDGRARDLADAVAPGEGIRELVRRLGRAGLLERRDTRGLGAIRSRLAYRDPMLDLAFVIQELGCAPLEAAGGFDEVVREARAGDSVLCFALTEPGAGSDLRAISATATPDGSLYRLDGEKHFISNAPNCDRAVVFAKLGDALAAFLVDAPEASSQAVSGHSIGRVHLNGTPARLISPKGMGLALGTLERCRPSVACAAWGMASRAFDEAIAHVKSRQQFGAPLAALPVVQLRVAEMALHLETMGLAACHACRARDVAGTGVRTHYESAVGKVVATEGAQRVIDTAVQLLGGLGVEESSVVQALYRGVRPLRIYEGATDVLMTLVAKRHLEDA
jgi:alkylation response protein AidB-like acyl-CoA dehydrogenase